MFKKILIANRGEIACRVIKTAEEDGHQDRRRVLRGRPRRAPCRTGRRGRVHRPAPSRESYLVADKIIAACKATGAQAVHPGYGFLSENEDFARRVEEEGITFIGPKHYSIAAMGDKIASKKLAIEAKVNTIPGYNDAIESPEQAVKIAQGIGYPVMIKASAGGGGKGLRVAFNDKEAFEGFSVLPQRGRNSFGDDRVFIEKFVEEPRHIEIQVLGDSARQRGLPARARVLDPAPPPEGDRGGAVALHQRCHAQGDGRAGGGAGQGREVPERRHGGVRGRQGPELLLPGDEHAAAGGAPGHREHHRHRPGRADDPRGRRREAAVHAGQIPRRGWAIECRINAEDPFRNFLPSTGRLVRYQPPAQTMEAARRCRRRRRARGHRRLRRRRDPDVLRLDDRQADRARVDRNDAIAKMREALNGFVIRGVSAATSRSRPRCWRTRSSWPATSTPASSPSTTPKGFRAEDVPHDDPDFLVALAGAPTAATASAPPASAASWPGTACASARLRRRDQGQGRACTARAGDDPGRRRHAVTVGGAQRYAIAPTGASAASAPRAAATAGLHGAGRAPGPVVPRGAQRPGASRPW
jgi:propionyl-CoA carboxylase alpha chain